MILDSVVRGIWGRRYRLAILNTRIANLNGFGAARSTIIRRKLFAPESDYFKLYRTGPRISSLLVEYGKRLLVSCTVLFF